MKEEFQRENKKHFQELMIEIAGDDALMQRSNLILTWNEKRTMKESVFISK